MELLREFCQRWNISEFALFGSVLREDFDDEREIDVLAVFGYEPRYDTFGEKDKQAQLEAILGRRVELLERRHIEAGKNIERRKNVLESAVVIYAV
jgi:predicted nucleotidyltransferase